MYKRQDVSGSAAQDRMKGAGHGLQAEDIRSGAVESKEYGDVFSEMFFELLDRGPSVGVIPIGHDMALVGASDGGENFRVHACIIVTRETAGGRGGFLLHQETM